MQHIRITIEDHYMHIMLDRGKTNALDLALINELIEALDQALQNPAIEGIIISGKQDFFSSGQDFITLYQYDELEMEQYWSRYIYLIQKLTAFPKPSVAAITGYSPSAGCLLTICCDYRIMTEGNYVIGLNDVAIGMIVPESIFRLYAFWLGEAKAYQSIMKGILYNPSEALNIGLVDEVVPFSRIQSAAVKKLKSLTQFDQMVWRKSKINLRKSLLLALDKSSEDDIAEALIQWWRPSTRSNLKTIIDSVVSK